LLKKLSEQLGLHPMQSVQILMKSSLSHSLKKFLDPPFI